MSLTDDVWCSTDGKNNWAVKNGLALKFKTLAVDSGRAYGISSTSRTYYTANINDTVPVWIDVSQSNTVLPFKAVDFSGSNVYAIDTSGTIYCSTLGSSNWASCIGVRSSSLSISGDNLCTVGVADIAFMRCMKASKGLQGTLTIGNFTQASVSSTFVCGVNQTTQLNCNFFNTSTWISLPGIFEFVSVENGLVLAIDSNNMLYYLKDPTFGNFDSSYITDRYICFDCFPGGVYTIPQGTMAVSSISLSNITQVSVTNGDL